jgi:hypothetical protein
VQKDTSEIQSKSPPKSWGKFILAMFIIAALEFWFLSLHHLIIPGFETDPVLNFYFIAFVPNMILGPLAFLWFGTRYSPVDKKITSYIIAVILSIIVIYLYIPPKLDIHIRFYTLNFFFMGICHAVIIWVLTLSIWSNFPWVLRGSNARETKWIKVISAVAAIGFLLISIRLISPDIWAERTAAWMSRAKGTLRSTVSSQLAYQAANIDKNYGSFQDLRDTLYIPEGYQLGNMIEKYSMTWSTYNSPHISNGSSHLSGVHTFTIVAYPRDTHPWYLMTFGITEDQIVRMYNPENSAEGLNEFNGLDDPRVQTWDPIL